MTCNRTPSRRRTERLYHVFAMNEGHAWPTLVATHRATSAMRACTLAARDARTSGADIDGLDLYAISAELDIDRLAEGERGALALVNASDEEART